MQQFPQDIDGLCRYHRDSFRLVFQLKPDGAVTEPIVEQLENDSLLLKAGGFGQRLDRRQIPVRKIAPNDVTQVLQYRTLLVNEELTLGLEVAKLQNQVHGNRSRTHLAHHLRLLGA